MKFNQLKNKKILILGAGLEGRATEKVLKKLFPNQNIDLTDKKIDKNYLKKMDQYEIVIKSPGIPPYLINRSYTTPTNLFFANVKNKIIGVTGTKGKSTTASLIYQILQKAKIKSRLLGNIGKPAIEIFLDKIDPKEIFVVELSSYQLVDINYSPWITVITSIFPEHLDYHQTLENYLQAKKRIIAFSDKNSYLIYHPKYRIIDQWGKEFKGIVIKPPDKLPFTINNQKLVGQHNLDNIKLAYAVAKILKIDDATINEAIKTFSPLSHRLEFIGRFKEIDFYDDAISTTPQSTIAAIEALQNIGSIFLGGLDRGYHFGDLVKKIIEKKIPVLIFFPDSGEKIHQMLLEKKPKNYHPKILITSSMEEAVKFVFKYTPNGTISLLSTASPSYSLWKNFEEKGNQFKQYVLKYGR
jgi:UDP-N-acetylmuramoylalanine--D-glutamate ligase